MDVGFLMGCTGESVPNFHYFYERNGLFSGLLKTAYYQSGKPRKNHYSLHCAERIDPSPLCRVWAFCLTARTRFLCKEISFIHKP